MVDDARQLFLVERDSNPQISEMGLINVQQLSWCNNCVAYLTTCPLELELDDVVEVPPTELLDAFFVRIGGLMMLSLDDDERLLGSAASMS